MSELQKALKEYLAVRRALGFTLEKGGRSLENFVQIPPTARSDTYHLAVRWAMNSLHGKPEWWASRLAAVRGFAKHRPGVDSRTEIPEPGLLPHRHRRKSP